MSKSLVKRLEKIEKTTTTPKFAVAVLDNDGYHLEGKTLTKEQFETWASTIGKDTRLEIVEIVDNQPPKTIGEKPCQEPFT